MSKRVYDRGYKIYLVPEATITLKSASSAGRTMPGAGAHITEALKYLRKHYSYALSPAPLLALGRLLRELVIL